MLDKQTKPLDVRGGRSILLSSLAASALVACSGQLHEDASASNGSDYRELRGASVMHEIAHSSTAPLGLLAIPERDTNPEHEVKPVPRRYPSPAAAAAHRDPVLQNSIPTLLAPTLNQNFAGIGQGFTGPSGTFSVTGAPPDTNGDVGPNHYVQTVNQDLMIWSKTGTKLYGPVPINSLFQTLGGLCKADNDGDPIVLYDQAADRWFISQFAVTNPDPNYHQCIAVSQTNDPTGAYYTYDFTYADFNDYGKAGVWNDAYYFTYNIFTGGTTFAGAKTCAFNRSAMLTGAAATQQCFDTSTTYGGILPADIDGTRQPAAGEPEYVVGLGADTVSLAYWKFHVDWATPANSTFSGPTAITVPSFASACNGGTCIPQSGTTQQLDSLADRMMYRLQWRQTADGVAHLVTNHSVTAGSSTGVRWYELRVANQNVSLFQAGTYAPDTAFRWMGSAAMDGSGGIGLGFSKSSSSMHPAIAITGRNVSDSSGTMTQGETTVLAGGGSQAGGTLSRWGDYSNLSVDPVDDCTFWFTTEYIPTNGTFNWATQVASFKLSGCGGTVPPNDFSITASPSNASVVRGSNGTSTISLAVTSGSAQSVSLSASGLPAGTTASFNPTSVTGAGSSTLTLAVGSSTATGTYPITVTGTGASATHSTTVTLTVTAPAANDFSIASSPSSVSIVQGGSGSSTISTTLTSGSAQTISLSASGLPSGATASFNPGSVSSGGSSTLTFTVGAATAPGSYAITVTGTGTSSTHATSVSLTVTASGGTGGGITNGGFESGLTGWTSTGVTAAVSGGHSGSSAAQVGSTSPSTDSSISQTFTAPTGATSLSFYYKVTCPDTVTYDWASATLKDNTTAATTTMLANTCSNSGAWVQATASVTAGHSYTLTLSNHDDNYAGDPTYTLYDDVVFTTSTPPPPPPPNPITNGGFETGSTSGWTSAGTAAAVSGGHSGSYAARLGTTTPTTDSSLSQTFTAPAGSSKLTFWYKVTCPDTVTYDWATATLKDNTSATTTTVLAKTCTNSGAWVQASGAVTAGHSYTLTLSNHDDNYASDPTYTLYDDVVVQ